MASSQSEARRAEKHAKARQNMLDDFERQRAEVAAATEKNKAIAAADRFTSKTESIEETLKKETIGLVTAEDFKRRREALEEQKRREAAQTNELKAEEKKAKKKKKDNRSKLSFAMDDEDEDGVGAVAPPAKRPKANSEMSEKVHESPNGFASPAAPSPSSASRNTLKNPGVDTSFLPDRHREERDRRMREELRQQWLRQQETMKSETIEITYSYWDGSGHRKSVLCKKGDSIAAFLDKCRQQLPELQRLSVDSLMYIKEDLIIPHHYTFYDFIVSKARGKSGPLFNFDVHDDIRMLADASVEKDESHAGKVVERTWYNRNKHIFPASRWELYEPNKDYGSYSIHDRTKA